MYERKTNSGHIVSWSPDDEDLAAQAVVEVEGTGINDTAKAKETYAEVDSDVAENIRERYRELLPDENNE
jgi:hypothetical protein